jgi:signal transduction histidine kinase
MSTLVAVAGWCMAAVVVVELRRRARLVADAAHELRGPLTAISLGLEALRRQPAARRRADALATELGRMQLAAEDVVASGRGRRAAAQPTRVVLREVVERSGDAWRPAVERRGGKLTFDWRADGADVRADPRRLAQAFGNLLANAVEHGGREIVVRGRPSPGGVRVEVEDRTTAAARGRGLRIAGRALEGAGGRLASVELPVERPG